MSVPESSRYFYFFFPWFSLDPWTPFSEYSPSGNSGGSPGKNQSRTGIHPHDPEEVPDLTHLRQHLTMAWPRQIYTPSLFALKFNNDALWKCKAVLYFSKLFPVFAIMSSLHTHTYTQKPRCFVLSHLFSEKTYFCYTGRRWTVDGLLFFRFVFCYFWRRGFFFLNRPEFFVRRRVFETLIVSLIDCDGARHF